MRKQILIMVIVVFLLSSTVQAQSLDDGYLDEAYFIQWEEDKCAEHYKDFVDAFNTAINKKDIEYMYSKGTHSIIYGIEFDSQRFCTRNIYGGLAKMLSCEIAYLRNSTHLAMECYAKTYAAYREYDIVAKNSLYKYLTISRQRGDCANYLNSLTRFEEEFGEEEKLMNNLLIGKKKCEDWFKFHENNYELIYGDGNRDKFDVIVFGHDFDDYEEFKKVVNESIENGFFYVPEWEALADEKIQNKFNFYTYKNIVEENNCYEHAMFGICLCQTDIMELVTKAAGMDRFVVYTASEDEYCTSNSILGNRAIVNYISLYEDGTGYKYNELPILKLIVRDYKTPDGKNIFNKEKLKNNEYTEKDMVKFYNINSLVILHESGHAFYKFQDEYMTKGNKSRPGEPNCLDNLTTAKDWWGDTIGFRTDGFESMHPTYQDANEVGIYDGCSFTTGNYRSTKNSIMNSHNKFSTANLRGSFGFTNDVWIRTWMEDYPS